MHCNLERNKLRQINDIKIIKRLNRVCSDGSLKELNDFKTRFNLTIRFHFKLKGYSRPQNNFSNLESL